MDKKDKEKLPWGLKEVAPSSIKVYFYSLYNLTKVQNWFQVLNYYFKNISKHKLEAF